MLVLCGIPPLLKVHLLLYPRWQLFVDYRAAACTTIPGAIVCSSAFFAPRRVIHRSGRYGFAHGPTTASYSFGIVFIAPSWVKPVSYANSRFIH